MSAHLRDHWQLLVLVVLVVVLWSTPLIFPLKTLVIFFHEGAHGLAAILTGGRIEEISVNPNHGGHAVTVGGNTFLIISAGYLGSLLIGMMLFWGALKTRLDRVFMAILGGLLILLAVLYIREMFPFLFAVGVGAAFLATARYLRAEISDLALRVIGLSSMIYVPLDIFDDTIRRSGGRSDARILAEHFGGPTLFWGVIWLVFSLVAVFWALRRSIAHPTNISFTGRTNAPPGSG